MRSPNVKQCSNVSWEQNGYYSVHSAAPANHVYQRRIWDEFKTVLSVAHANKPVERAENVEYRNELSDMCWGTVYCSIESIILNHPVLYSCRAENNLHFNYKHQAVNLAWDSSR